MSKNTINMQLSQLTRGEVDGDDFDDDDDNVVELGYKPSMIHFYILGGTHDDVIARATWYENHEDNLYVLEEQGTNELHADVDDDGIVSAEENGFTLDGTKLKAFLTSTDPTGFTFEAYGGNRIDAECPIADEAHPDAVDANTAMDTTDYLPEL